MKTLILAAGYGTRLQRSSQGTYFEEFAQKNPKALVPLADKPLLNYLIEDLQKDGFKDKDIIIITNQKFHQNFLDWQNKYNFNFQIINDGTTSNENRLGAIKDIKLAIDQIGLDNYLILASDTLLETSLIPFIQQLDDKNMTLVGITEDKEKIKRCANIKTDENNQIIKCIEKPSHPISNMVGYPIYYYTQDSLQLIGQFLKKNPDSDAPGHFLAWLAQKKPVYVFPYKKKRFDIGNFEEYQKTNQYFKDKK